MKITAKLNQTFGKNPNQHCITKHKKSKQHDHFAENEFELGVWCKGKCISSAYRNGSDMQSDNVEGGYITVPNLSGHIPAQ